MNMVAMQDMDNFRKAKQGFEQGQLSYDEIKEFAIRVLQNKQQAEKKITGKIKTRIDASTIAKLLR